MTLAVNSLKNHKASLLKELDARRPRDKGIVAKAIAEKESASLTLKEITLLAANLGQHHKDVRKAEGQKNSRFQNILHLQEKVLIDSGFLPDYLDRSPLIQRDGGYRQPRLPQEGHFFKPAPRRLDRR